MYAGAIRCTFSANSPMLVFVHPVIRIPGMGGVAFGAGLQSVRSESFAAVIFGLPFPTVSTYTVISRCSADPTAITFFEALDRELGLKLVKQTRMYPVIVVDHIEEKPVQ